MSGKVKAERWVEGQKNGGKKTKKNVKDYVREAKELLNSRGKHAKIGT